VVVVPRWVWGGPVGGEGVEVVVVFLWAVGGERAEVGAPRMKEG